LSIFIEKLAHDNLLAIDSPTGPMAISLIKDDDSYRALVRTTQGSERLSISAKAIPTPWYRKLFGLGPTRDAILGVMSRNIPYPCLTLCKDPNLPNELIAMEERQVIRSYKFGVGYLKEGQKTERDMLSNRSGTFLVNLIRDRGMFKRIFSIFEFFG
jgi:RAP1 GTPase activating protein 1